MKNSNVLLPLDRSDFLHNYWESQPLHIERSDARYFESLLSEEKIIALVREAGSCFPDVQAINASKALRIADYTTDGKSICPDKMMQCYRQGATIIVSEVHKKFAAVQELCMQFSRDFCMRSQANAYLSPAGNQGFYSHYDTHDVFVLQVAGRKKFRFYDTGIELPFTEDTYTPDNNSDSRLEDEVDLCAGDTLYIPRGIVHDAIADDGEPSLHITVGAFPYVLRDLVQEMVQVAAERDVKWRSTVDLSNPLQGPADLYQQASNLFSDAVYREALSRLADDVALSQPSEPLASQLSGRQFEATAAPVLSCQSRITVRQSAILGVEHHGVRLKLRLPGKVLSFEEPLSSAVEAILNAETVVVADVPALDDDQKLALCQQLVDAGAIDGKDA